MANQILEPEKSRLILPWKTRVSLFFVSAVTDASRRHDGTVNRRLFTLINSFTTIKAPPDPKPRNGVKTLDITIDASRDLWFRLFVPTNSDPHLPVIVFFHGGGFVYLGPDFQAYDHVCRRFARKVPAVVVSVNYRLAPEHRYPAQHEDCFDVLKFLDDRRNILPENSDVSRCFLVGDSAGGNLAHHVAKRASELRNFSHLKVIGVVAIQPFFGGEERTKAEIELDGVDAIVSMDRTDWMWRAFIPPGSGMNRDHPVINVSGPNSADISKLDFPATVVVVAGFDSLKDWQTRYYQWLKKSGKEVYLLEYPNMIHAFYGFPELPESGHLINEIKNFIHKQCSKVNIVE